MQFQDLTSYKFVNNLIRVQIIDFFHFDEIFFIENLVKRPYLKKWFKNFNGKYGHVSGHQYTSKYLGKTSDIHVLQSFCYYIISSANGGWGAIAQVKKIFTHVEFSLPHKIGNPYKLNYKDKHEYKCD